MFTNINLSRFILCTLVLTIFSFLYQWLVRSTLLAEDYAAFETLWRSKEEMSMMLGEMLFFNVLLSGVITLLYSRHHEGLGIDEGVRFGVYIGLLIGTLSAMAFLWLPITTSLATLWFVDGLVFSILAGILLSLTYAPEGKAKKKK